MVRKLPSRIAIYMHATGEDEFKALQEIYHYFSRGGYQFVNANKYLEPGDDKRLFVSFDDTSRSWLNVLPVLTNLGMPATFYLDTIGIVENGASFGERDASQCLRTSEVQLLVEANNVVGIHTHAHPDLGCLSVSDVVGEILKARTILEKVLGYTPNDFAIPFGMPRNFRPAAAPILFKNGIKTIAYATPCMQYAQLPEGIIQRSLWRAERPFAYNLRNLCTDGQLFVGLTGRSPVG